jgi:hypothetical protein
MGQPAEKVLEEYDKEVTKGEEVKEEKETECSGCCEK